MGGYVEIGSLNTCNSELAVVPGTSHFLTIEKPDLVNPLLLDFLEKEPMPT